MQLLSRFYGALDERDYRAVADCFDAQGEWRRLGKSLRGPAEVLATLAQRNPHLVTHHLVSNCLWEMPAPGRIQVRFLLTVFQSEAEPAAGEARRAPSPRVGFADAEMVQTPQGWRLSAMEIRKPAFVAGA